MCIQVKAMNLLEARIKMQNDAFSAEEALASLHRLFDTESWEHMFRVLEQKQAMLMNPHPDTILLIASEVLQVCTQDAFPTEWAITHAKLGMVYTELGCGASERNAVLALALAHYQQALQILTEERFPGYWAIIQQGLCAVYLLKSDGNIADNLQQSIVRGQAALRVLTRMAYPFEWASAHTYLGEAYRLATLYADLQELYSGRAVMQEQALRHLEAALQVYTMHDYPLKWAKVQRFQGLIYLDRVQGKRDENLARSSRCLKAALQAFNREFSPFTWSEPGLGLGFSVF
jgi:hypothetical protein